MATDYIEITIPSVTDTGHEIPEHVRQREVHETAWRFSGSFGGATATIGEGFYTHNDGSLAIELVTIVKAYALDGIDVATAEEYRAYCRGVKHRLSQEAVLLSINGTVEFI